jgi:hypothetical protein
VFKPVRISLVTAALAFAAAGWSQAIPNSPADAMQISYAANLSVGDSVFNITNAGTMGGFATGTGNLCVNVYAFDPREAMISCCSCMVTPDGLYSLSARNDLISNTLTPAVPSSIVVKLVASTAPTNGLCNAGSAATVSATTLASGLRAWATTLEPGPQATYVTVSQGFQSAYLSASELSQLTTFCSFVQWVGSGYGICNSCRTGALSGEKQ